MIEMRRTLLLLMLSGLAACAGVPFGDAPAETPGEVGTTPAEAEEAEARSGSAEAIRELIETGRASRANGDYANALANVERAIRIEPRNSYLWIELGETHLSQGNSQQAAASARKAMSVAGPDRVAKAAAERLLERALGQ